ncbi:MAG TPA: carbamoyltransferase HypF [Rhodopila sp.]|nr:carbamoyltransferase HypF [Rhodopila sp.]
MPAPDGIAARRIVVGGRVQGVGFRPFVYRTARELGLAGWVRNRAGKVLLHAEGNAEAIARLEVALSEAAPTLARPVVESSRVTSPEGAGAFRILPSEAVGSFDIHLPPDLFCCDECLEEMRAPHQRRHRYPFTNCTQCGPRYTIISGLPYDRPCTAMAGFPLCATCANEYADPADRRFHAQPLACPACGPQLRFSGAVPASGEAALAAALAALRGGLIVAVKGVGGYHLMCDARSDAVVQRLRARKRRPTKPLAVMFPEEGDDGLAAVRRAVDLDAAEARACVDNARPIVLGRRRADCRLSSSLAPGLTELGVFLPYSPLHHLLLAEFGAPLVATSGNISGEPVMTDPGEAERRLHAVADAFLHHDRPILRPADDSVVRAIGGRIRPVRLGRGIAPLELDMPGTFAEPVLAVGGHMKGAVALGWDRRVVVSPHVGDLDSPRSLDVFAQVIADLGALYKVVPRRVLCDAHPGYASTRWARRQALPVTTVQHHAAHASALAGEHPEVTRWLMFTWDGVGLGDDGTLWGGEALVGAPGAWRRVGSLRPFRLTGGDAAGRQPWRSAAAVMWETGRDWMPLVADAALAAEAWRRGVGLITTSSAGRLFDAAAALVLGCETASFEGEAPMLLGSVATAIGPVVKLPLARDSGGVWLTDWAPLLPILSDARQDAGSRAAAFHASLAAALADQAAAIVADHQVDAIGLTGGVFQNRCLAEAAICRLEQAGFQVKLPEMLPVNDGGLAFGQLMEGLRR